MSRLLSMTSTLSPRQPAARSSAWMLQRRSLNSWPEADGLSASDDQPLASTIPCDFLLTLLTLTSFPHPSGLGLGREGGKNEAGRAGAGVWGGNAGVWGGRWWLRLARQA